MMKTGTTTGKTSPGTRKTRRQTQNWVIEVGHSITRDEPPSYITWRPWGIFKRRVTAITALRLVCMWSLGIARPTRYIRMRNVASEECIERLPRVIEYAKEL